MQIKALSSVDFLPLTPKLSGMRFNHTPTTTFSDGVVIYKDPFLKDPLDVSINNDTLAILVNNDDIIDQSVPKLPQKSMALRSGDKFLTNGLNFAEEGTVFTCIYEDEFIQLSVGDLFLTVNYSLGSLSLAPKLSGSDPQRIQRFNFLIQNNTIILFTAFVGWTNQRFLANENDVLQLVESTELPPSAVFDIANTVDLSYRLSRWVNYNEGVNIKDEILYSPQHLILNPYKTSNLIDNISLKNQKTSAYNYRYNGGDIVGRTYHKIFTGTNQEQGLENIYLGFSSDSQEIVFTQDRCVYFHYPQTAPSLPISQTTLISQGAHASNSPWRADKIFKKQANYKKYSNWGDASGAQTGVYFITWLKETDNGPVWMDRFYNPDVLQSCLSSVPLSANDSYFEELSSLYVNETPGNWEAFKYFPPYTQLQNVIWDSPSTMTMDPGALYGYCRIGENLNNEIVKSFEGDSGSLKLLDMEVSTGSLVDKSIYENVFLSAGNVHLNFDNVEFTGGSVIVENFGTHLCKSDNFTVSFKAFSNDWNQSGNQILSNYGGGGFNIGISQNIMTPFHLSFNHNTQEYRIRNTDWKCILNFELPLSGDDVKVLRTYYEDDFYVVVDTDIFAIDNSGNIKMRYQLDQIIPGISNFKIQIDKDGNFVILDTDSSTLYYLDGAFNIQSSEIIEGDTFVIDSNNEVFVPSVSGVNLLATNHKGDHYWIQNGSLYRDYILMRTGYNNPHDLLCDDEGNTWLIDGNTVYCITSNNSLRFLPVTIGGAIEDRKIIIATKTWTPHSSKYVTIWNKDSKILQQINYDGSVVERSFNELSAADVFKDTGFEYQNIFSPSASVPTATVVLMEDSVGGNEIEFVFSAKKQLTPGWHHFVLSFNRSTGEIAFYINGAVVDKKIVAPFIYRMKLEDHNVNLLIGANSYKLGALNEYLQMPNHYSFAGQIKDLMIYNIGANQYDVGYLKNYKVQHAYDDLIWDVTTGPRNYIEEIEHFFKHKLPGSKSQFFNIIIKTSEEIDAGLKSVIEVNIRNSLDKMKPFYATLKEIKWTR